MKFSITFLVAVLPFFVEAAPGSGAYSRRQAQNLQKSLSEFTFLSTEMESTGD
jgi:hypothetical protein